MFAVLLVAIPAGGTKLLSGAVAVIVMSSLAPTGIDARVHVTTREPWLTEQDQFDPLAAMLVNPVGSASATVTLVPASGPALRGC
jgi:hypothetical protein